MADDLSWIDHPANLRANAVLLRAVADQAALSAAEIERLTNRADRMLVALKGIAEYCSGDDRTLGAIGRLASIRNTAEQAVRIDGQFAPEKPME